jgi:hypothetical protein
MRRPIVMRSLLDAERAQVTAGLRSPKAVILRRCQIPHMKDGAATA